AADTRAAGALHQLGERVELPEQERQLGYPRRRLVLTRSAYQAIKFVGPQGVGSRALAGGTRRPFVVKVGGVGLVVHGGSPTARTTTARETATMGMLAETTPMMPISVPPTMTVTAQTQPVRTTATTSQISAYIMNSRCSRLMPCCSGSWTMMFAGGGGWPTV